MIYITDLLYGYTITGVAMLLLTCTERVHLLEVLLQRHAGLPYDPLVFLHHLCSQEWAFGTYSLASRWRGVACRQLYIMLLIYRKQENIPKL